jgi:hypothetical protein
MIRTFASLIALNGIAPVCGAIMNRPGASPRLVRFVELVYLGTFVAAVTAAVLLLPPP